MQTLASAKSSHEVGTAVSLGVPKRAVDTNRSRRTAVYFDSARSAIAAFFRAMEIRRGATVLCPAYVGWSSREGSGVLDPLVSLGLDVRFYRVDFQLGIDLTHLQHLLQTSHVAGVIVIPFFGHVPQGYCEAINLAKSEGALVLEDEAHALLTDLIEGTTGRFGHAAVLSIHKHLPLSSGGALLLNPGLEEAVDLIAGSIDPPTGLLDYDLPRIASVRKANSAVLSKLLIPLAGRVDPLWDDLPSGEVLHSFPVVIRSVDRDHVYELMNASGFGVTSLYHTLVSAIPAQQYPISHSLSRCVLNLPVHQDVHPGDLEALIERLSVVVDDLSA